MIVKLNSDENGIGRIKLIFYSILFIILCVFGWLTYRFIFQTVNPVNISITAPPPIKPPGPGTYTDPAKVYSVTFPARWSAVPQGAANIIIPISPIDNRILNFIPIAPSDSGFGINGLISLMAFKSDPKTILMDSNIGNETITTKSLTINGNPAYFVQKVEAEAPTYTDDEYIVYHNGVTILLYFREEQGSSQFVTGYDASDQLPNFNFITNSIKFLN